MIAGIKLKFGRTAASAAVTIPAAPVTIFVGPNNSGKSRVLREIEQSCRTGTAQPSNLIVSGVEFEPLDERMIDQEIDHVIVGPNPGEAIEPDHIVIGSQHGRYHLGRQQLAARLKNPQADPAAFCQWFLAHSTLMLDGASRMKLVADRPAGDLQTAPQNSLQRLFRDKGKREELRRITKEAFGLSLVVDPTNLGHLRLRLSQRPPGTEIEELGIHDGAVRFHAEALHLDQASDGVRAFVGVMLELTVGDPRVLLIDEPEAFLHPALASMLGAEISRAASRAGKRVFVSTHSTSFLMGCVQSGTPVNIVRLTYRGAVATARLLPSAEVLPLMRNPLLRSTGLLTALFYEFVVVTESDSDRAFYQEVNERLLRFKPDWGIPNCLFINAQNKQTVQTLVRPLRQLGIPAAAIVDVDVVKDGGLQWSGLLAAGGVPELMHQSMAVSRSGLNKAFGETGKNMKRDGGVSLLRADEREAAESLFRQLAEYGVFVVPGGELESWLADLKSTGHGPGWLIEIFQRMGEDPTDERYVRPTNDDVWRFVGHVRHWLTGTGRRGIPG